MRKNEIKIKNWPFKKGERAKLSWISEPYKGNKKWMIDTYFDGECGKRKITLDWATIHFLVKDKYYIDGNLNDSEVDGESYIEQINLNNTDVKYSESPWQIWYGKRKIETKSKSFIFFKEKVLYVLPIYEVIRAVLAPNRFLLNRIVEMDTIENYYTFNVSGAVLNIYFTKLYNRQLLKEDKINQLAWLITNEDVFKMFNQIGWQLCKLGEVKLDYLFKKMSLKVRLQRYKNHIQVVEILGVFKKRINVNQVNMHHPLIQDYGDSDEVKKRSYIGKSADGKVEIDASATGATNSFDEVNNNTIQEYIQLPKIIKEKTGRKLKRGGENENTKKYFIENDSLRTVADEGGQVLMKGLEFSSLDKIGIKGELENFIDMLKQIEKDEEVASVEIIVGELPGYRTFSTLSDEETRRKYAIGKVVMVDGGERSIIDIERDGRALSMLILKAQDKVNWKWIYSKLIYGVVNESGVWSNKDINEFNNIGIVVERRRHGKVIVI